MKTDSIDILGVNISVTNVDRACQTFEEWITDRKKSYVCVAPVSTVVDCQRDPKYRDVINNANMITPDGMPLVWVGRLRGNAEINRTYGPDIMAAFCALSQEKGYRHYFYGGTEQTNQKLVNNLKVKYPQLDVVGTYAPGVLDLNQQETEEIIAQINNDNPDVLWIGLGSPKQDYWMHIHRDKLNVPVIIGVGAAFDFLAGTKKQAPLWMQRNGLEWFFRLINEPKRLWRRYLFGNTKFLYLLMVDALRRIMVKSK